MSTMNRRSSWSKHLLANTAGTLSRTPTPPPRSPIGRCIAPAFLLVTCIRMVSPRVAIPVSGRVSDANADLRGPALRGVGKAFGRLPIWQIIQRSPAERHAWNPVKGLPFQASSQRIFVSKVSTDGVFSSAFGRGRHQTNELLNYRRLLVTAHIHGNLLIGTWRSQGIYRH